MAASDQGGTERTPAADLALVRDAENGVPGAEERLLERIGIVLRIVTVLNRRYGSHLSAQDVEDLAQETIIKVWGKLSTFEGETTLKGWLHQFAHFELLNRLRKRSRAPRHDHVDVEGVVDSSESDRFEDEIRQIEDALAELGPPDAPILRLKHFEGLSFTQIGERLGIPPSTAKARYYRGLSWMQRRLAKTTQEAQR